MARTESCWRVVARIGSRRFCPIVMATSADDAAEKARRIGFGVADPALPWMERWQHGRPSLRHELQAFQLEGASEICRAGFHVRAPAAVSRANLRKARQVLGAVSP